MEHTAHEWLRAVEAIEPGDHNAAAPTPDEIDTQAGGVFTEALFILHIATVAGTTPTIDVKIQEGDTSGGSFADVAGAAFTQVTDANDETVYVGRVNLRGRKRYLQADITHGGTPTEASYGMGCVLSGSKILPVTQVATAEFNV